MIDFRIEEILFQSHTMSFYLPIEDPRAEEMVEDYIMEFNGVEYYVTVAEDIRTDTGVALKYVEAEIDWMRLADRKKIGTFELNHTAAEGLALILADTGWSVGPVTSDTTAYLLAESDLTRLDLLWKWAKITGNEVKFHSSIKQIEFIPEIGRDLGFSFRYTKNLKTIKRRVVPPKVTKLYVFGQNNLSINNLNSGKSYLEDYSYYTDQGMTLDEARSRYTKEDIFSDSSFIEEGPLYAAGVKHMETVSQPEITYEATVVDLSTLTGYNEGGYECGDRCFVADEPMNIGSIARVSRRVRWPYEPEKDEVELSFSPVLIPDNTLSNTRPDPTRNWELFVSRNTDTPRQVRINSTVLNRIRIRTIAEAEWVMGYKIQGIAEGSSTLTIELTEDEAAEPFWSTQTNTFTDGENYEFDFTFGQKEIPAGVYTFVVRAYTDSASAGLDIPEGQTSFWILARGSTRQEVTLENSIRFDFNGSSDGSNGTVQFFDVPDDVTEILVECHGAGGSGSGGIGRGGMVKAKFPVVAGTRYDVYVGGVRNETGGVGGWPDGGSANVSASLADGYGGSGSSSMRPESSGFVDSIIVAGGGGGINRPGSSRTGADIHGGDAGFYQGKAGFGLSPAQTEGVDRAGFGATQLAGGAGGTGGGGAGSFGQGGNCADTGNNFHFAGGGGGGGWYGGGGAGAPILFGGGSYAGDGGGGSGWLGTTGYDLEIQDAENTGHGFIIVSWETPEDVA